jgi:thioredoxin-like negative regulator of GroEL
MDIFVIAFVVAGCPPCDSFKQTWSAEMEGVQVVLVDVKERPDLAAKCGVKSTPTFVAIENESPTARMVGYVGEKPLRDWLRRQKKVLQAVGDPVQ